MLAAMIKMIQTLGLEVIAEGVENLHQLRRLRESGCAQAQGYLLSEPLQIPEVQALLARVAEDGDSSRTLRIRSLVAKGNRRTLKEICAVGLEGPSKDVTLHGK